jgi:hypothetical protein
MLGDIGLRAIGAESDALHCELWTDSVPVLQGTLAACLELVKWKHGRYIGARFETLNDDLMKQREGFFVIPQLACSTIRLLKWPRAESSWIRRHRSAPADIEYIFGLWVSSLDEAPSCTNSLLIWSLHPVSSFELRWGVEDLFQERSRAQRSLDTGLLRM